MTEEQVKNFLALYEEVYSYKELSNITGYSVDELREFYDELFENKELDSRKKDMLRMKRYQGVWRIHPVTLKAKKYEELAYLKDEGYYLPNVITACRQKSTLCGGYLWRFGKDIDAHHIERSIRSENPELFTPVTALNPDTGEYVNYSTLLMAHALGYNKGGIMSVIEGKKKTYKGLTWSVTSN